MGFFDFIGNAVRKVQDFGASVVDKVKTLAPAVFNGVKRGIVFGKQALELGKQTLNNLRSVPYLGEIAAGLADSPLIPVAEKALDTGDKLVEAVDKSYQYSKDRRLFT